MTKETKKESESRETNTNKESTGYWFFDQYDDSEIRAKILGTCSAPEVKVDDGGYENRGGVCPYCHETDGYLNIFKEQYGVCEVHKVYWDIGCLFSSWRCETQEEWDRNAELLEKMTLVESVHPDVDDIGPAPDPRK